MTNAMTDQSSAIPEPEWGAFLAIDWADKKHAWSLCVPGAPRREHGEIEHSPEAIHIWITELTTRFAGRPIAVCIEQSRGALLFALSKYGKAQKLCCKQWVSIMNQIALASENS